MKPSKIFSISQGDKTLVGNLNNETYKLVN